MNDFLNMAAQANMGNMGMGNYFMAPPNQYMFQNPNEIMHMPGQENFFNPIPMDYGLMNNFQPAFVTGQPGFNPNDVLSPNNLILNNNNLLVPNNLALGGINGNFLKLIKLKYIYIYIKLDLNFLNMNMGNMSNMGNMGSMGNMGNMGNMAGFNGTPSSFILGNGEHGQFLAGTPMMQCNG